MSIHSWNFVFKPNIHPKKLVMMAAASGLLCTVMPVSANADEGAVLSQEELRSQIPGTTLHRIGASGGLREWTNNPDGTAVITRYAKPGSKHAFTKATGHWTISEEGKYCLDEDWSTSEGGPLHWCTHIQRGADGNLELVKSN
jgi:hypothetical protein